MGHQKTVQILSVQHVNITNWTTSAHAERMENGEKEKAKEKAVTSAEVLIVYLNAPNTLNICYSNQEKVQKEKMLPPKVLETEKMPGTHNTEAKQIGAIIGAIMEKQAQQHHGPNKVLLKEKDMARQCMSGTNLPHNRKH